MQDLIILNLHSEALQIKKLVIRGFVDCPRNGFYTTYVEICARANEPFVLIFPNGANLVSRHGLSSDEETLKRIRAEYEVIDRSNGRYRERIGNELIDITPQEAEIMGVSPPPEYEGSSAFRVNFTVKDDNNLVLGTWLKAVFPSNTKLSGVSSAQTRLSLITGNVSIDHFYLFLVLPHGYESTNNVCYLGTGSSPSMDTHNPVHTFELPDNFPIFPEWRDFILGQQVLRTREDMPLSPFMKATLIANAKSNRLLEKLSIQVYITGLGFGLSANLFISALFYYLDVGPTFSSVALLSIGLILSLLTGIFGYRAITK